MNSEMWDCSLDKMSLSYLQLRLKQNEEDFARISNIDLDNHVKVQQK